MTKSIVERKVLAEPKAIHVGFFLDFALYQELEKYLRLDGRSKKQFFTGAVKKYVEEWKT